MNPPIIITGNIFEIFKLEKSNISALTEPNKNANSKVKTRQIKATDIIIIIFVKTGFLLKIPPLLVYVMNYNIYL